MVDTLDDVEPPYRSGDSDKVKRDPKWPSVEDATRRINVLIDGQAETDMAARDLIVLMRELGRVTAEGNHLKYERQEIIDNALEEQTALEAENKRLRARLSAADNAGWALKVRFDDLKEKYAALEAENDRLREADALYKFNVATEEEAKRNLIPPTQGEEETARSVLINQQGCCDVCEVMDERSCGCFARLCAALRQRADEATRAENEACAKLAARGGSLTARIIAFAIRARIAP